MISNTLFISYTIMCFISLQAITLVLIIIKHNDTGGTPLLKATRNFIIVSVILGLFYYITYYREVVLGYFAANILLRALDGVIFYAMGHSWIKLLGAIMVSKNPKLEKWKKYTTPVFSVLMILSAAIYIFLLDEYYSTQYMWAEITVIVSEVVLGITVVVFTIAYMIHGYKELNDRSSRMYVLIVSIFVNFNNLWNNTVVIAVFIRSLPLNTECTLLYGITSVLLLITNLLTLFYLYTKDFSPIFFGNQQETHKAMSEEEILDMIAANHRLTERERDVMILAYQGLTNPDIAERLFISSHTVKRHMHNIFEKLDVSTRIELIHLIQNQAAFK